MGFADIALPYLLPILPPQLTHFYRAVTPLSTLSSVVTVLLTYFSVIFGLREIMKQQKPMDLRSVFRLHNIVLSVTSGILLVWMLEELGPIVWKHGLFYGICDRGAWTPRLEFYYMINYYMKYLELLDTVFLALKKKPMAFLHVFHHSSTVLLTWSQLAGKTSVSWVPITLNLGVHVIMYYYYYATAGGARFWWKQHLTTMQITQFIIDLVACYFSSYNHFVAKYALALPHFGSCEMSDLAGLFGCTLLTTFLGLFINFYINTYTKAKAQEAQKAAGNSIANGYTNSRAGAHTIQSISVQTFPNGTVFKSI